MIGKLRGIVERAEEGKCIVDVNGVGYILSISERSMSLCKPAPEPTVLWVETIMRAESLQLFGFAEKDEQNWFRILTAVQGVGPKVALVILSSSTGDEIRNAVLSEDKSVFARASGVGPKLASRLITELKSVVGKMAVTPEGLKAAVGTPTQSSSIKVELLQALEGLGFKRHEAQNVIDKVMRENESRELEGLLPLCLRDLAK